MKDLHSSGFAHRLAALALFATLVTGASLASVAWTSFGALTAIWPTNVLILLAVLRGPASRSWTVSIGAVGFAAIACAVLYAGAPPAAALFIAATNLVEVGAALVLLRLFRLRGADLTRPRVLFGFLLCCAGVAPAIAATVAAPAVQLAGGGDMGQAWIDYWWADALGMILIGPLGMVLTKEHLDRFSKSRDWGHGALLLLALGVCCALVVNAEGAHLSLLAPLAVCATLRFGPLGAAGSVFWAGLVALTLNLAGLGSVAADDPNLRSELFQLQLGLAILPLVTLPIAAVLAQRDRAAREAEAADRAKSAFLANMSHELRTPLNGIVGVASLLTERAVGPQDRELAEVIRSSGIMLERLLGDLLDIARIEAGRLETRSEPFDLEQTVRETAALFGLEAQAKGLRLKIEISEAAKGIRLGDGLRVRQILTNLLSNAIKFTEAGEVGVDLNGDEHDVILSVRDTGVGFDPALRHKIFGRFEQADGSITRRFGGSGLGLAISRSLAEAMGGTLDTRPSPTGGSLFVAALPLGRVLCEGEQALQPTGDSPAVVTSSIRTHRPRILAADDNPTNRRVLELILATLEADLVTVADGAQAVQAFEAGHFDIVLMDMQMPVMDGLEATRRIREFERLTEAARTPLLMVSANALPDHIDAGRAAGADGHVTKPIDPATLLNSIARLASLSGAPADA